MEVIITPKVWEAGNTAVITIPMQTKRLLDIEVGDVLEVRITKVYKQSEIKSPKKEKGGLPEL